MLLGVFDYNLMYLLDLFVDYFLLVICKILRNVLFKGNVFLYKGICKLLVERKLFVLIIF